MILVVLGLVALSYYPIVVSIYGPVLFDPKATVGQQVGAAFVVVWFHILVSLPPEKKNMTNMAHLADHFARSPPNARRPRNKGRSDAVELLRGDLDVPGPRAGRVQARRGPGGEPGGPR